MQGYLFAHELEERLPLFFELANAAWSALRNLPARRQPLGCGDESVRVPSANAILATRPGAVAWPARPQRARLDPGPHGVRDDFEGSGDLLDGQELFGVWFVLWRRTVVGTNGLEHLFTQVAKLVADDVPQELTQRCLDA
jgi:hypothetical protein